MIQFVFSLLIGIALLLILYFFARGGKVSAEGSAQQLREAKQTLDSLQFGLLPNDLVHRIFAREDLEYVRRAAAPQVQSLFLSERKDISLAWVRRVRGAILSLMRFHRDYSRFHRQISLFTELRLAVDFAGLLLACRMLEMLFYFRGPYAAPRMVNATASAAARLCTVSERSLAFLNVPNIRPLRDKSTPGNATV